MTGNRPLLASALLAAGVLLANLPGGVSPAVLAQGVKQDPPKTGAQLWTLNYKKGDASRLRIKTTILGKLPNGQGEINLVIKAVEKVEVKDVSAKNEVTLVHEPEEVEAIINGVTQSAGGTASISTWVMSKNGLARPLEEDPPNQMGVMQAILSHRPVPASPVKVGDSWKTELDNRLVPGKKVSLLSTFAGSEKLYGIDTLKIKFETSVPTKENSDEKETIRARGVYNLDPKTGHTVRSDITVQNIEIPLQTPIKGTIEIHHVLIVPGVNDRPGEDAGPKK
jgi:hypothetical protein